MDAFNFFFTLFGLLLGLSLAEVLGGFARILRLRRSVRIGWLVPMLAIFVMLDIISFWSGAWRNLDWMRPEYGHLFFGLLVTGLYYVAASIIFPASADSEADYDAHYFAHRRQILGSVAFCNMIAFLWLELAHASELPLRWWIIVPTYFVLIAIAIFSKGQRLSITALSGLIAFYASVALFSFSLPPL